MGRSNNKESEEATKTAIVIGDIKAGFRKIH
jgi:hypothetical protein